MENLKNTEQFFFTLDNCSSTKTKKLPQLRQRVKENSRLLPIEAVDIMTEWYDRHYANPYPTYRDCEMLATKGKITINQVKQWFVNVRRRTQNQFRKTRDTRCTKRKNQSENVETEKKIENMDKTQAINFYQSYSLDSSTSDYSTPSLSNSPTAYRFNYSASYISNQNSPTVTQNLLNPITSSSPVQNQNNFSQYSSSTFNIPSEFNNTFNYYSNNNSDYLSYYQSPQYYHYYNNYKNNYQYY